LFKPLPFETLRDAEGSVVVGWAGDSVLHARVQGGLSAELGARYAAHIPKLLATQIGVHYFADVTAMTRYDLLARSAFVRMALAHRRAFESFNFLLWPVGLTPVARAFAEALGASAALHTDPEEFERRLARVAPLARYRLDPATWGEPNAASPRR
jgi:hypothetical protein